MAKSPQKPGPILPPPADRAKIIELGFMPVRASLIEVAAFLDRVERYGVSDDFRCAALRDAARALSDGKPERARRILESFSDPTTEPAPKAEGKAASGAYRAPTRAK